MIDFVKAQEYTEKHRMDILEDMLRFMQTDTILFWSSEPNLFAYQQKHWQPIIDKVNEEFNVEFKPTTEITPPDNRDAMIQLSFYFFAIFDEELTACYLAAQEMKSALLGVALIKQKISVDEAFEAAFLEELYQNQKWGEDAAALNARAQTKEHLKEIMEYLRNWQKDA